MDAERERILEEEIMPALVAMVEDTPLIRDPAELEHLALTLAFAVDQPPVPVDAALAVIAGFEGRGDSTAAGVLLALAMLTRDEIAGPARAAAERLRTRGVKTPYAKGLGHLAVTRAELHSDGEEELLVAVLKRPGQRERQFLALERELHDGHFMLGEGILSQPMSSTELAEALDSFAHPDVPAPKPITVEGMAQRVVEAAERTRLAGSPISSSFGLVLPLISRILTGDPATLPKLETLPPWEDDDPDLDLDFADDHLASALIELLLAEYKQQCEVGASMAMARAMLQFKAETDGLLGRWEPEDVEEWLLDELPEQLELAVAGITAVPGEVASFLEFLAIRGSLSGAPLPLLQQTIEELRDEFLHRARVARAGPRRRRTATPKPAGAEPLF